MTAWRAKHISTYVISGAFGAGKTTVLQQLVTQKPYHEIWAILNNGHADSFKNLSQSGVFESSLTGCACCTAAVMFPIYLARLINKAHPDRLWIELSGDGNFNELCSVFSRPEWQSVIDVKAHISVIDASKPVPPALMPETSRDILILNRAALNNPTVLLPATTYKNTVLLPVLACVNDTQLQETMQQFKQRLNLI